MLPYPGNATKFFNGEKRQKCPPISLDAQKTL
jgi:hypothetical protein